MLGAVIRGFNIDVNSPVLHSGPQNSMFGFDVSVHRYGTTNWLLVGAPKAETAQDNVVRGGAVYKCPAAVDSTQPCEQIPFDTTGAREELTDGGRYAPIESKSNQWFGATVVSSGDNGVIVACAPRYVYFTDSFSRNEPVGVCYTSRSDFSRFRRYSPCAEGRLTFTFTFTRYTSAVTFDYNLVAQCKDQPKKEQSMPIMQK